MQGVGLRAWAFALAGSGCRPGSVDGAKINFDAGMGLALVLKLEQDNVLGLGLG